MADSFVAAGASGFGAAQALSLDTWYQDSSNERAYNKMVAVHPDKALGRLLRLRPLNAKSLPPHPALASQQVESQAPLLSAAAFAAEALQEATAFTTAYLPARFKSKAKDKSSPPSTAPVELLSLELAEKDLPTVTPENWFARISVHENAAKAGTASWEEFETGDRRDHCLREKDYTPDVFEANKVLDWHAEVGVDGAVPGGWQDVQMGLWEMCHSIPGPLKDRVFAVCCVTAKAQDGKSWVVVQIPVVLQGVQGVGFVGTERVQEGMYVSVERGELVEEGSKVKWIMATASDAKGVLPMWAQKMGVPGAVVKDVGLFMDWADKRRKGQA